MALVIFCQWWLAATGVSEKTAETAPKKPRKRSQPSLQPTDSGRTITNTQRMVAAGILAGLLPLVHTHTFLVVMGVGTAWLSCSEMIGVDGWFSLRQRSW